MDKLTTEELHRKVKRLEERLVWLKLNTTKLQQDTTECLERIAEITETIRTNL